MNSRRVGKLGEDRAISYLRDIGFDIIDRNFYAKKFGEIDIIATKEDIWHFIEVKSAKKSFNPIYNLSIIKLSRVVNSALYYLEINNLDVVFSIDVIIVSKSGIDFLENITI